MPHIYKREFVASQGTELVLPAGETDQCWSIGFPPEGEITRLILRQSTGVASAATVNLFDRQVCDVGSGSSVSLASQDPMTLALARIIPEQTLGSGAILDLFQGIDNEGPWSYRNREGTFAVPVRAVYLHVSVASNTGGKRYEFALETRVAGEAN